MSLIQGSGWHNGCDAFLLICGALSMTRSLPFGLMLGVSRRTYYLGTALLIAALGVVYGLGLTVLQASWWSRRRSPTTGQPSGTSSSR